MSYVSLLRDGAEPTQRVAARGGSIQSERADIVDRNGVVLATSVPVMSAFVNPRLLLDPAGRRAQDRHGAARSQVRRCPREARRRQDLRLGQARPDARASRTGSIASAFRASSSRPRSAASIRRAPRPPTSWAMPASTMPAWPASSASSTSSCRAARRCSLPSTSACSAWSSDEIAARGEEVLRDRRHGHRHGRDQRRGPRHGLAADLRSRTAPRPSPTKRCSTAPRWASTSRARPSRSSTRRMALDTGKVDADRACSTPPTPIQIDRFTINDDHAPAPAADRAGDLQVFVEHRLGQDGGGDVGTEAQRAFFDKLGFLKPLTTQLPELGSAALSAALGDRSTP